MKPLLIPVLLLGLAACASPSQLKSTDGTAAISTKSSMPRGILHTDGHGPIDVSVAGKAQCRSLTAAETRVALAHSNAVRASAGLPALRIDSRLQKAAQQHACDMASRGVMEHRGRRSTGPGMRIKQLGYQPRITAENIAAGAASIFDLNGALREWGSAGAHRKNTLIPQMRDMGIGHALSPDGRFAYWSVVYAAPK